jgi:type I pantothenate kinase
LQLNIQPTRERANLILKKGKDHLISQVLLRK